MKFRMAENSLFAVLLRSPWWISFLLAAITALLAHALLPAEYKLVGSMGGLPFAVIGVLAGRKQWSAPSARHIEQTFADVSAMGWKDFSARLEAAWVSAGFSVQRLDGRAADFRIVRAGKTTLVAARRWKAGNHGVDALRALVEARQSEDASQCAYICLAGLPQASALFAQKNAVGLYDARTLTALLRGRKPL
jgi:restriction system protein